MPTIPSAAKMMRVAERRRARNRSVKSAVKTSIRKAERGVAASAEDAPVLVSQAARSLDKAATKGVLHPNNAARRKSRLMKKLNASRTAAASEVKETKPVRRATSRKTSQTSSRATSRTSRTSPRARSSKKA